MDEKKLADSFRWEFNNLYPLSQECCIYRVPHSKRRLNPDDYTPKIVSIGPFHHGKEELQAMEDQKIRYLQQFLQRTKVSIEDFLAFIKGKEPKLLKCYAETVKLGSYDFVRMVLLDAVFLVELLLRGCNPNFITNDDRIFRKPWMINQMWSDFWLLENQLPLFILNDLFNLAKTSMYEDSYVGHSLVTISGWFRKDVLNYFLMEENLLEIYFSEAQHFLDLLRLCLQRSQRRVKKELIAQNMPSAMELHQAGVKFKLGSTRKLLDVTFNKGVLEIPLLTVYENTERFYRNVLVFENMHVNTHYFNDYVLLMSYLVNSTKDEELLIQNGVIGHRNSERLSSVFHNLRKDCGWACSFQYACLVEVLQNHCRSPWNRRKAILRQNYFNSPWASISIIAAVILLLLTFIQTTCSIIAL